MTQCKRRLIAAATIACLLAAPTIAAAKSAGQLGDLVGARGAGGETELEARGWVLTDGHKGASTAYTYWWHPARKDCLMVATRDGRYDAISDVTPADCNQRGGGNAGGAVAAGALAAVLIAAAASHKSGHHANGQHYADNQQEAEYERGFNDGMYNEPYHNYSRSDGYSSGYQNGVEQRGRDTGYRSDHRNGAGYAASAEVSDLVGARGAGAESDMIARGFSSVDGFTSGNGKGTVWWNARTRQCLQMIVVNGAVDSITDIQTHPRCR
jgi:hypothetical protein